MKGAELYYVTPALQLVVCLLPVLGPSSPASFLRVRKKNLLPGSKQIKPVRAVLRSFPFRKAIIPGSQLSAASVATLFLLQNVQTSCLLANICRDASANCVLDLHEVLAGGRKNFSSSSEDSLIQQTPRPVLPYQHKPCQTASFLCAPAMPACVWTRESSDLNLEWSFTSAPGMYHPSRLMCQSCYAESSPASPIRSCQAEPGAQQLTSHGTLLKCTPWHRHNLNKLSLQQLSFSHSHKPSRACQQLGHIRNGKERLIFFT